MDYWENCKKYHSDMRYTDDAPNGYALIYICDTLKFTTEQRYWLSFLYSLTYCGVSAYYIFTKFPDFNNLDINALEKWWEENKKNILFQTDRAKVKNFNLFIRIIKSYKELLGDNKQEDVFKLYSMYDNSYKNYDNVYDFCSQIYYFGRFSLFNYMELLNCICGLDILPTGLDLKYAESARNGLCYACNKFEFITLHHQKSREEIDYEFLQKKLEQLKKELQQEHPNLNFNYWNIETILCAYKKLFWGSRYFGYYIDRQLEEIRVMEKQTSEDFNIFYKFRETFLNKKSLGEKNNWKGIRKERLIPQNGYEY